MKKMGKSWGALLLAMLLPLTMAACTPKEPAPTEDGEVKQESQTGTKKENIKLGVLQLVEHDALNASYEGFMSALADGGYVVGQNLTLDFQNAQNDQSNLKTMSQKFVNDNVDLALAIATPAAQSLATETTEIPILGTAITDYVAAGLIESNEVPGGNVSGTSDKTPVKEQFTLLTQLLPEAKTVGIMYNSSEANSEVQAKLAEEAAKELGLKYEFGTVTTTNDIAQVVQSIVEKVDVLYIPTDNTFASAVPSVTAITNDAGVPVIVGEVGMCKGGGLATIGLDYYNLGYQTGGMALRLLEGAEISKMPIEYIAEASTVINLDAAKAFGIEIPQSISVDSVIENGELKTIE